MKAVFNVEIRKARQTDLADINAVIRSAVMQWNLPERVKRLAVGSYLYNELDFEHLEMLVALKLDDKTRNSGDSIIGVVAWEAQSESGDVLLHGLYVKPEFQHQAVGRSLLKALEAQLLASGVNRLRVKAHKEAVGFFERQGFMADSGKGAQDYSHLMVKALDQ